MLQKIDSNEQQVQCELLSEHVYIYVSKVWLSDLLLHNAQLMNNVT